MAVVTGMTAEKIQQITGDAVVSASIDPGTGVLTLQTQDGQALSVGSVDTDGGRLAAVSAAYPVGSIFMSTVATNPATQLGVGTWVAWGAGRVPVGVDTTQTEFDTVEEIGGAKTHTLTVNEMPNHNHSGATLSAGAHFHTTGSKDRTAYGSGALVAKSYDSADPSGNSTSTDGNHQHTIPSNGGGAAHNNLQPYITCYMWKRTA